jgi:2-dehydro-3-deoxyphosphogluconate aldolase/(4S)-4-hydroxy-2-oxoglutarate aldolase
MTTHDTGATMTADVLTMLKTLRLLPVVVLEDAAAAEPLGAALKVGGLPLAEVTFRTPAAEEALRRLAADPELVVGAGTVVRPEQVDRAVEAGAKFIVSPGLSTLVVKRAQALGIPVFPGVATPTEITAAVNLGLTILKLFPAESLGGVSTIKALSAPFSTVQFIPTGGVKAAQLVTYLECPAVLAVGGSWMVSSSLIAAGDFDEITRLTAEAVAVAAAVPA